MAPFSMSNLNSWHIRIAANWMAYFDVLKTCLTKTTKHLLNFASNKVKFFLKEEIVILIFSSRTTLQVTKMVSFS